MMNTEWFGAECKRLGFEFYTGVPCSFLKPLINYAINECEYVTAVNEGEAVSIAAGAAIGGKKAVVLMQNSGLTNASSPLTSLIYPFQIPILGFVSLRGEPGLADEPQHELMGQITGELVNDDEYQLGVSYPCELEEAVSNFKEPTTFIENISPFSLLLKKERFEDTELQKHETKASTANLLKSKEEDG